MPPRATLNLRPRDVTADEDQAVLVQTLHDALDQSRQAAYWDVPDEFQPAEAFFARSPDDALQWICRQTSHVNMLRVVKEAYKELDREADKTRASNEPAIDAQGEVEDAGDAAGDDGSEPRGVKRRKRAPKEKTTRALNKALVDKINLNLVQAVANSQDWENAKVPVGLSNEEQKYRRFATGLSGIGVGAVAQMIAKASAVGTMDVLRDWQAIFAVWKRQNYYGRNLFQPVAVGMGETASQEALRVQRQGNDMVVLASPDNQDKDEAGLTAFETESFAYRYFDAQKTQVDGIADDMRHRWKMDGLYEEFDRLEKEIKRRSEGTRGRGVRYADTAKEHLFASTYRKYLGRVATKGTDRELWLAFGDYLDWGRRWNALKKRFGSVGIFGILPRSLIPNAFVEKTLSQARLSQWADMVVECNPDVMKMAKHIEPLFLACMEESEPPPEFAFLENLDGLPQTTRPFTLFLSNQEHPDSGQRIVEEDSDEARAGNQDALPTAALPSNVRAASARENPITVEDSPSSTISDPSPVSSSVFNTLGNGCGLCGTPPPGFQWS